MTFREWLFPFSRELKGAEQYTVLRAQPILNTIDRLGLRIEERFPNSGLSKVCREFYHLAIRTEALVCDLADPIWPVRIIAVLAATLLLGLFSFASYQVILNFQFGTEGMAELLQASEAVVNELIFLGLALYFLIGLEARLKRGSTLKVLHQLRSVAHIIDMHQLTKDPSHQLVNIQDTESSPSRILSREELIRYLDYCAEILSLNAKIGALFAQNVDDTVVLTAVNDLESLTQGLSAKIWQKIMILDLSDG